MSVDTACHVLVCHFLWVMQKCYTIVKTNLLTFRPQHHDELIQKTRRTMKGRHRMPRNFLIPSTREKKTTMAVLKTHIYWSSSGISFYQCPVRTKDLSWMDFQKIWNKLKNCLFVSIPIYQTKWWNNARSYWLI